MVNERHVTDSLASYALGCLEAGEARVVAAHLATCPVCRTDLTSYMEAVEQLGRAVPQTDPPASLKHSLLARLSEPVEQATAHQEPSGWERIWSKWLASPTWAAASLVLILVLGISNLFLWQQVSALRSGPETGQETLQTLVLQESEAAPGATGMIVISVDGEHGTLVVDRLPVLDEDHEYQLWLIDENDERTSGAIFSVSEEGYGSVWVGAPEPLISYPAFGVTIEPKGGSNQPTGERVLGGEL